MGGWTHRQLLDEPSEVYGVVMALVNDGTLLRVNGLSVPEDAEE